MNIDRNNYEQYLLDYLECNLKEHEMFKVEKFLSVNPDLAAEFSDYTLLHLSNESIKKLPKSSFYRDYSDIKEITTDNFDEICIAYFEGDLDKSSQQLLIDFLKSSPEFKKDFRLIQQLRLIPDRTDRYLLNKKLKKQVIPLSRKHIYLSLAAAAAILLMLIGHNQFNSVSKFSEPLYSERSSSIKKIFLTPNLVISSDTIEEPVKSYKSKNKTNADLAAFDTTNSSQRDEVRLAALEIRKADILLDKDIPVPAIHTYISSGDRKIRKRRALIIPSGKKILLGSLHLGIKGMSSLTENDLALTTETDRNGNLTSFAFSAGGFEIGRRSTKNIRKN